MAVPAIAIQGSGILTSPAVFSKSILIHHADTKHRFQTKWPHRSLGRGVILLSISALGEMGLLRWVSPTLQVNDYVMCVTTQKASGFPEAFCYLTYGG